MGFLAGRTVSRLRYGNFNLLNKLSPAQILVLGFIGLILAGAILLSLPVSSAAGKPTKFIDALFTATSAVCVTG